MGSRAYERVVRLVHGERPEPKLQMLPTALIVRASTGPAGAKGKTAR
jgi:DNA-binding LacI/PurR family transcriptional regulator